MWDVPPNTGFGHKASSGVAVPQVALGAWGLLESLEKGFFFPCGNTQCNGARLRSPFLKAASLKLSKEGDSFLSCQRPSLSGCVYGLGQLPPAEAVGGLECNERSWRRGGSLERNTTWMLLLFCSSVLNLFGVTPWCTGEGNSRALQHSSVPPIHPFLLGRRKRGVCFGKSVIMIKPFCTFIHFALVFIFIFIFQHF